mmetsp:Transcript_12458/g.17925  ORF Transcript_12458/g.17925 Transcript_12458/m.17925 type:complete len:255 (-) Transcript_12458:241-1005(-)
MSANLPPINDFDTLRREATKLERQLEDRISKYQQLAQRITTTDTGIASFHTGASGIVNPSSLESGTMSANVSVLFAEENSLSNDIDRLLSSFSDLQASMANAASQSSKSQHSILVKRYREILFDLQSDYHKVKNAIQRRKETMELFSVGSKNPAGVSSGADSDMEHLLRERNSIQSSMNLTSNILGQADDIHADLRNQRRSLNSVGGTVLGMAQAVPGINKVIDAIRKKRNQDEKIVMGVIAACILFTLWYLFG